MAKNTVKNLELFPGRKLQAYGGELRKKAKHRGARPLICKSGTMHIVLRSSEAKGANSFQHSSRRKKIEAFIRKFSSQKGVQILSLANVGNHFHLHIRLTNRVLYKAWIRGISSGIAMMAMGLAGLKRLKEESKKFWDQRPFSKIIQSFKHYKSINRYVEINMLEGMGMSRGYAELIVKGTRGFFKSTA